MLLSPEQADLSCAIEMKMCEVELEVEHDHGIGMKRREKVARQPDFETTSDGSTE